MTADQFVKALKDEGVTVAEHAGWRTHNRAGHGSWGPMNGVVIHHTAGTSSLSLVYNGTSALPGPLCHTHLSKAGVGTMVGNGRANHAGSFAQNAHNAVVAGSKTHPAPDAAEPVDGNAHYYGIEIENLGNGKDVYPTKQYDAAVRWAAAICRFHGWTAQSVIGHKEGTRRKVDPKGPVESKGGAMWDMDVFRTDVQKRLDADKPAGSSSGGSTSTTKPVVSLAHILAARKADIPAKTGHTTHKAEVLIVENALHAEGVLDKQYCDGSWGTKTDDGYDAFRRKMGYKGDAAKGAVGLESLRKLAARHNFTAKA
jgi:hypothetical protein